MSHGPFRNSRTMDSRGYIIQYLDDQNPDSNDLLWADARKVALAHLGKTDRLPLTVIAPDQIGRPTVRRAHRAWEGRYRHWVQMMTNGAEPYCNRLPEVSLNDLPFIGLEPDQPDNGRDEA